MEAGNLTPRFRKDIGAALADQRGTATPRRSGLGATVVGPMPLKKANARAERGSLMATRLLRALPVLRPNRSSWQTRASRTASFVPSLLITARLLSSMLALAVVALWSLVSLAAVWLRSRRLEKAPFSHNSRSSRSRPWWTQALTNSRRKGRNARRRLAL